MRALSFFSVVVILSSPASADDLVGETAFGDWSDDAPGIRRLIRPEDLPAPFSEPSQANRSRRADAEESDLPKVPEGFEVARFAEGLDNPRTIAVAPNGDIFVAESGGGRVRVFRAPDGVVTEEAVFADGLDYPYGLAFYPPGPDPEFLYVGNEGSVVRYRYRDGDMTASSDAEVIVPELPTGGHATRAIAFSPDGTRMYVAVGSRNNLGQSMEGKSPAEIAAHEAETAFGAGWGEEEGRAAVLVFDPDGKNRRFFATGLRNCSGLTVQPATGALWCAVNERDGLGDNLPPDYVSRVEDGAFFGWPWVYIGDHPDSRQKPARTDLEGKVAIPDVLIQAHSAPLGIAFYDGPPATALGGFPAEYKGDAFVALHGSWNRSLRTGYKLVRVIMKDGIPTGEYEDFLTGFVKSDESVWGRPVGVAIAADGALLVSEDGNDTIWRITHQAGG